MGKEEDEDYFFVGCKENHDAINIEGEENFFPIILVQDSFLTFYNIFFIDGERTRTCKLT